MKTIYKYKLNHISRQEIEIPTTARILSAGVQNGDLCVWAAINDEPETSPRFIYIFGTGHLMPEDGMDLRYIDTVQESTLVWHIFEGLV
jgi:hypothetical protein